MKLSIHRLFVAVLAGGFLSQVLALPVVEPGTPKEINGDCDGPLCEEAALSTLTALNPHQSPSLCKGSYCPETSFAPGPTVNLFSRAALGGGFRLGGKGDDEHGGGSSGGSRGGDDTGTGTESSGSNGSGDQQTSGGMSEQFGGSAPEGSGAGVSAPKDINAGGSPGAAGSSSGLGKTIKEVPKDYQDTLSFWVESLGKPGKNNNPAEEEPKYFTDAYDRALKIPPASKTKLKDMADKYDSNYNGDTVVPYNLHFKNVPLHQHAAAMGLHIDDSPDIYEYMSKAGPKNGDQREDLARYSTSTDGTTIISDMHKEADYNPPDKQVSQSELLFRFGQKHGKEKFKNSDNILQSGIKNDGTNIMMIRGQAATGKELGKMAVFRHDSKGAEQDAFRALMGIQNLKPIFFMLRDHSDYFGRKEIKQIYTFVDIKKKDGKGEWVSVSGDPGNYLGIRLGPIE